MKNKITQIIALLVFLTMAGYQASAQSTSLKLGTNPTLKDPSALLELEATDKGALLPRVALKGLTDATTIANAANALTVFNTATTTTGTNDVTPGYYYWSTADTKWIKLATVNDLQEPWKIQGTANNATLNTQNIYQQGKVSIGSTSATAATDRQLEVVGDFKTNYINGGVFNGINTNYTGLGAPVNVMYVTNNADLVSATNTSLVLVTPDMTNIQTSKAATGGGTISAYSTTNGGNVGFSSNSVAANTNSSIWGYNNNGGQNYVELSHNKSGAEGTNVKLEKLTGVNFQFKNTTGVTEGEYTFPRNNGTANQVLTTNGSAGNAQLSWQDASTMAPEPWKIQATANNATANTDNIYQQGKVAIGTTNATALSNKQLDVVGDFKTEYINGTTVKGIETNADGSSTLPGSAMYGRNALNILDATLSGVVGIYGDSQPYMASSAQNTDGTNAGSTIMLSSVPNVGSLMLMNATNPSENAEAKIQVNGYGTSGLLSLSDEVNSGFKSEVIIQRQNGVQFRFRDASNADQGRYLFPRTSPANNQVLARVGTLGIIPQLGWVDASTLAPEPWKIKGTTNNATLNTENIYQTGSVAIGTQNGLGIFNVDAAKNNPTTGTPTATNVLDDIIVTPGGRIGFGYSPSDVVISGNQLDDKVTFQANDDLDINYSLATTNNAQAIVHRNIISSGTIATRTARPNGTSIAAFEGHTSTSNNTFGGGSLITQQRAGVVLRTGKENNVGGEIWFGTSGASQDDGGKSLTTTAGNIYRAVIDQRGKWAFGADPNHDAFYRNPTERLDLILGGVRIGALGYGTLAAWRTAEAAERPNYISTDPNDRIVVADANGVLKTIAPSTSAAIIKKDIDYAVLTTDETILVETGTVTIKITLPAATAANKGKKYNIKMISGTGAVNVVSLGGTLDGVPAATGITGSAIWQGWVFQSDGTDWYIVSRI